MTLQKQIVSVPFGQGVDTKSDTKALPPGKLTTLENGIFTKTGAVEKRYGVLGYNPTNSFSTFIATATRGMGVLDSQMLMVGDTASSGNGHELFAWAGASGRWVDVGKMPTVASTQRTVFASIISLVNPGDVAEHNGVECHVWFAYQYPQFVLRDRVTGAVILAASLGGAVDANASIRLIWSSTLSAFLFVQATAAGTVIAQTISMTGAVTGPVTLAPTQTSYALDVVDDGSRVWLIYQNAGTVIPVSFTTFGGTLTTGTSVTAAWTTLTAWKANSGHVVVAGSTSGNVIQTVEWISPGTVFHALTTLVTASGTVGHICGIANLGASSSIFYDVVSATATNYVINTILITNGAFSNQAVVCRSVGLASRPFTYGGRFYVLGCFSGNPQKALFLIDSLGTVYGQALRWSANGIRGTGVAVPSVSLVTGSTTQFLTCGEQVSSSVYQGSTRITTPAHAAIEFDFGAQVQAVKHGSLALFASSIMGEFDGVRSHEHGFLVYPESPTGAVAGGVGSLSAGTYQFCAVYEFQDANGFLHRSAQSVPITIAVAAGQAVTFNVPTLRLTNRDPVSQPVFIRIYRTVVNGSFFYLESQSKKNDPTVDTVSASISDPDSYSAPPLYSNSPVLDHTDPPGCAVLANYRGRMFAAQGSRLFYSLQHAAEEPVAWNGTLYIDIEAAGGDITALAVLDEKLVVFKAAAIYVISGNGPDNTGSNSDYQNPYRLATDVGAVSPAGIAVTAMGIIFKAAQGFYLLDRSMATHYVGAPVEAYNGLTVTSAQVITAQYHVRFTTSAGTTLVFDYGNGQWSTFTNQAAVGGCVWNGLGVYVDSSAVVWVDNKGVFTDNAPSGAITQIKLKAVTGWLTFAAVQGFQRVRRVMPLGDYKGAHTLTVKVAYDYNEVTWDETATIDATTILTADAKKVYQFGIHLAQQKCEAIRLSIEDTQSSAFNEGMSLTALSFEVGVKEGAFKFPTTKRLGTV